MLQTKSTDGQIHTHACKLQYTCTSKVDHKHNFFREFILLTNALNQKLLISVKYKTKTGNAAVTIKLNLNFGGLSIETAKC